MNNRHIPIKANTKVKSRGCTVDSRYNDRKVQGDVSRYSEGIALARVAKTGQSTVYSRKYSPNARRN